MLSKSNMILACPPTEMMSAKSYGLPLAHMAYRVGGGPHLFRANLPNPIRGGLMVIDDTNFDGRGEPGSFCQEVVRECAARGYSGVICDFERTLLLLGRMVSELSPLLERRGWPLYVTEPYGRYSKTAKVLIPTALSGGSFLQRLEEAAAQYGAARVALAVERSASDFFLPSPTGQGLPMSREELHRRMEELNPSIFFSNELCAHYFTYMNRQNGAHFVLFDDAASIRKKLHVARSLDISDALLPYSEVSDILGEILSQPPGSGSR